jgi:hypothetical protein
MTCLASDVVLHQYSCVMDTLEGNQAPPKDADRPNLFRSCWLAVFVYIAAALGFVTGRGGGGGYTRCLGALGRNGAEIPTDVLDSRKKVGVINRKQDTDIQSHSEARLDIRYTALGYG